jgi:hypothetical protein
VTRVAWIAGLLVLLVPVPGLAGVLHHTPTAAAVSRRIAGTLVDYTQHGGADRRIWSQALCQRRDMYVYLPPCYDPAQQYPFMLWLHGFMQDEQSFPLIAELLDCSIREGKLPPMIVAAPDGSLSGRASYFSAGSFFINSDAGRFEDYIIHDVLGFMLANYSIRPERDAHVLAGVSMGGFGAYNLGIKYQDFFKIVIGIFPPLNLRWVDCHCRYMSKFDPCCWGWRTQLDSGHEVVARFYGFITIRLKRVLDPLFGRGPDAVAAVARENPIEMLPRYGIVDGLLDMYIAYAGRDEFNIDAQVESFLYRARQMGITVAVGYDPRGRHRLTTALKLYPGVIAWLGPRLAPYAPGASEPAPAVPAAP